MAGWFWMGLPSRCRVGRSRSRVVQQKEVVTYGQLPSENNCNWAELPSDLVRLIATRLTVPEHIRLRAICTLWASALTDYHPLIHHFPYLMAVCGGDKHEFSLIGMLGEKSYHLPLPLPSNIRVKFWCVGCQDGWLVIVQELAIILLNPITGAQIPLPSFCIQDDVDHRYDPCVTKVVLSAIPSTVANDNFVAIAITKFGRLAFVKAGDQAWTLGQVPPLLCFHDIVHHDGMFFGLGSSATQRQPVLDRKSQFLTIGFKGSKFEFVSHGEKENLPCLLPGNSSIFIFLVSSPTGDLLQVRGTRDPDNQKFKSFTVRVFLPSSKGSCWVETRDLAGRSLFIDGRHSMSLAAREIAGLKENCIYFVDDHYTSTGELFMDAGLFDIRKGIREPFFPSNVHLENLRSVMPLWFMPSLS